MEQKRDGKFHILRTPLVVLLPLTALLLSVFGLVGASGMYREYSYDPVSEPSLVVVMKGIRDEVFPDRAMKEQFMAKTGLNRFLPSVEDELTVTLPADAASELAAGQDGSTAGVEGTKTADGGVGTATGAENATTGADASGSGTASDAQGTAASNNATDDPGDPDPDPSKQTSTVSTNEIPPEERVIPEESTCPVCEAKDYGNVSRQYQGPEGWEPEKDLLGMFALKGTYLPLEEVDESYFDDALFIGDSRVDGLADYGGLQDHATFVCRDSLTVYKLFDEQLRYKDPYGNRGTASLSKVLSFRQYGKIYLQIGINEVGLGTTKQFYEEYRTALMKIRAAQPLAILYIDGIMHVTAGRSSSDSVMNNTNIVDRNRAIATLANGKDIFYLDMNPYVCDENGNLLSELSMDHAHLKASAHGRWKDFLMEHAAVR
ncbi:MAG: hypothetical protein K6E84_01200 [Lachnospiraceae bacterium]|nr:hypothetical protein [Lachnospiraceae bacterium]